jgi:hypothetical protein
VVEVGTVCVVRFVELDRVPTLLLGLGLPYKRRRKVEPPIEAINILINDNHSDKFTTSLTSVHFTYMHVTCTSRGQHIDITCTNTSLDGSHRIVSVKMNSARAPDSCWFCGGRGEVSTSLSIWQSAGVEMCSVISSTDLPSPFLGPSVADVSPMAK